jgi:AraC-like DNA-binding protein
LASSFKAAFGETPHQYLLTRRLERAASLLRSTDYSVAAICMEVGLAIVGSFTTSFKRVYGRTPTEYRADHPPAGSSSFEEDRGRDRQYGRLRLIRNRRYEMLKRASHVGLWVHDQDEALPHPRTSPTMSSTSRPGEPARAEFRLVERKEYDVSKLN